MKNYISFLFIFVFSIVFSQKVKIALEKATQKFLASNIMSSGHLSFNVSDDSGLVIYHYDGNKLLSTASTQKIMTAIAALEILGPNYQYSTTLSYTGRIEKAVLKGDLILKSNGDPTLGSWRYEGYYPKDVENQIIKAIKANGIEKIEGSIIIDDRYFAYQTQPGGWPWNDMGNYYGAGVWGVNWNENQMDLSVKAGQEGQVTEIQKTSHDLMGVNWLNNSTTGLPTSGDQSYIFIAPYSQKGIIEGTLPANKTTVISGAMPNPPLQLVNEMKAWFQKARIEVLGQFKTYQTEKMNFNNIEIDSNQKEIITLKSPKLEKIIYWFLRKSVNFYGETLLKTIGMKKENNPNITAGVTELSKFYSSKKIPLNAFSFADGSGLSPQNYVCANAQVLALNYARKQAWFASFLESLPNYNAMKMKSGTIKNCKAYAGYHTSKTGEKYTFSILVNNYKGEGINEALFQILDVLK